MKDDTKNKNPLFDFIEIVFKDQKKYDSLYAREKSKYFFMFNRFCSIMYPVQANLFNHIKILSSEAIDYWQSSFIKKYGGKIPSWIYTKSIKNEKNKTEYEYKKEIIDLIKEKNQISNREIKDLINFYPSKFKQYYKEIESLLS